MCPWYLHSKCYEDRWKRWRVSLCKYIIGERATCTLNDSLVQLLWQERKLWSLDGVANILNYNHSISDMSCLIAKSQSTWTKRTPLTPLPTAQTKLSRPLFTTQPPFTESIKNDSWKGYVCNQIETTEFIMFPGSQIWTLYQPNCVAERILIWRVLVAGLRGLTSEGLQAALQVEKHRW